LRRPRLYQRRRRKRRRRRDRKEEEEEKKLFPVMGALTTATIQMVMIIDD